MKRKCFLSFFALMICTLGFAASDADIALFNAVKAKNLVKVNQYIYANANQRFEYGGGKTMTAFQLAVENGSTQIARSLIVDGNADVNTDGKDEPPLFIAIRKDNSDLLQLIVSNGANVNAIYNDMTPLMYCYKISKGDYSRNADLLLKNLSDNFDWGHKDAEGNTVMHLAAMGGNAAIISTLLNQNESRASALLQAKNLQGITPIGIYIFNARKANKISLGLLITFLNLTSATPLTIADFTLPASAMTDNGIFSIGDMNIADTTQKLKFFTIFLKGNTNKMLASERDSLDVPLLCHAIENEWEEKIVDLIIRRYGNGWEKIRTDGRRGENAIDIMRRCHSEDKYQEIFDAYSN